MNDDLDDDDEYDGQEIHEEDGDDERSYGYCVGDVFVDRIEWGRGSKYCSDGNEYSVARTASEKLMQEHYFDWWIIVDEGFCIVEKKLSDKVEHRPGTTELFFDWWHSLTAGEILVFRRHPKFDPATDPCSDCGEQFERGQQYMYVNPKHRWMHLECLDALPGPPPNRF